MSADRRPGFDRIPGPTGASGRGRPGFDRVRGADQPSPRRNTEARKALFSAPEQTPPLGALLLDCSSCRERSAVTLIEAFWLSIPSLHLPFLKPDYPSWMRCPACNERTWLRITFR